MTLTLLDTGPLVAYFNRRDEWHGWVVEQMKSLAPPLLTCEPVLTEACFLVSRHGGSAAEVIAKVREGVIAAAFDVQDEAAAIEALMRRFRDRPMALADACLVRLSELHPDCRVFTLDADFRHYRRHGRRSIPTIAPW